MDVCITCGQELAIMERNRAECWECQDCANESYSDDEDEELVVYEFLAPNNFKNTNLPMTIEQS